MRQCLVRFFGFIKPVDYTVKLVVCALCRVRNYC